MDKYIILYTDYNERDSELFNILNELNLKIIRFLLKTEEKRENFNIIEIYPDEYTEEILIKDSFLILYFSRIIRSKILLNLVKKFKKNIIFGEEYLENIKTSIISKNFEHCENFENYYNNLAIPRNEVFNKNIKMKFLKINSENEKIFMITYFKNTDNKLLNILQKKCIIENSKNKNINKIIVICENLENELKEIESENIIFHNFKDSKNKISFKNLFEISNNLYSNKIIAIIRSDIVLPNQDDLNDIELDLSLSKNDIYCISRVDRLINGNIVKSLKLNNILYSTEQDIWIFKSPLEIDQVSINSLENIFLYDKFSELYLNNILKTNNYNLINNSKYKIIRLMYDDNINNRPLLDNALNTLDKNNIFLLPDSELLNKFSIQQMIEKIEPKEIYALKCQLFNKYYINKINFFI